MPAFLEARHDAVVGSKAVSVVFGMEWFQQDGVGVDVKGQHNVAVAAEGSNWEAYHAIRLHFSDGIHLD